MAGPGLNMTNKPPKGPSTQPPSCPGRGGCFISRPDKPPTTLHVASEDHARLSALTSLWPADWSKESQTHIASVAQGQAIAPSGQAGITGTAQRMAAPFALPHDAAPDGMNATGIASGESRDKHQKPPRVSAS